MTAIASRLAKLETKMGDAVSPGRVIVVKSSGATGEEVDAFLALAGIDVDHRRDQVIHLRTLFLDRNDEPTAGAVKIEVLSIADNRKR